MTQVGAITGLDDVAEQQETAGRQQQGLRDQLTALQQAIVSGEAKLDDKLGEGLIAVYGAELASAKFREKAITAYRDLNTRLQGQAGQLVLIVHRFLTLVPGCYGFGKEAEYQTTTEEMMGVLESDTIFFAYEEDHGNPATAYLPTASRVLLDGKTDVQSGMISISETRTSHRGFLREENRPIDLAREAGEMVEERFLGRRVGRSGPGLEIAIGSEEIARWFRPLFFGEKTYLEVIRASIEMGIEPPIVERFGQVLEGEREKLQKELDAIAAKEAKLGEELAVQPDRKAEILAKAAALGIQLATSET